MEVKSLETTVQVRRITVFIRFCLILLLLVLSIARAYTDEAQLKAQSQGVTPAEVFNLINLAASNVRTLAGYTTISRYIDKQRISTVKQYIRNERDGARLSRTEVYISDRITGTRPAFVYITNRRGIWLIKNAKIERLDRLPRFGVNIPLRYTIGAQLNMSDDVQCTRDESSNYFGHPATKIVVGLGAVSQSMLQNDPTRLKAAWDRYSSETDTLREKQNQNWAAAAKAQLPVTYIYWVNNAPPFILSWQAYALSGAKIADVSYQDFKVEPTLPDSLFSLPDRTQEISSRPVSPQK